MPYKDLEKRRAAERRRRRESPEKARAKQQRYRETHREERRAADRRRYWRGREEELTPAEAVPRPPRRAPELLVRPWRPEEDAVVLDPGYPSDLHRSRALGRTIAAIGFRRRVLTERG